MTWEEIVNELCYKMDVLLEEAKEKGCCFSFDITAKRPIEYRKNDAIILWTDDPTFGFSVEEWSGDE